MEQKIKKIEGKEVIAKHHHKGNNFSRILLGLILVFVGVIYFLKTTGLIDIQINFNVWQLWPLIIIFLGISLISVRGWLAVLLGIIISLVVLSILFFAMFPGQFGSIKKMKKPPFLEKIPVGREQKVAPTSVNMHFEEGIIINKTQRTV